MNLDGLIEQDSELSADKRVMSRVLMLFTDKETKDFKEYLAGLRTATELELVRVAVGEKLKPDEEHPSLKIWEEGLVYNKRFSCWEGFHYIKLSQNYHLKLWFNI